MASFIGSKRKGDDAFSDAGEIKDAVEKVKNAKKTAKALKSGFGKATNLAMDTAAKKMLIKFALIGAGWVFGFLLFFMLIFVFIAPMNTVQYGMQSGGPEVSDNYSFYDSGFMGTPMYTTDPLPSYYQFLLDWENFKEGMRDFGYRLLHPIKAKERQELMDAYPEFIEADKNAINEEEGEEAAFPDYNNVTDTLVNTLDGSFRKAWINSLMTARKRAELVQPAISFDDEKEGVAHDPPFWDLVDLGIKDKTTGETITQRSTIFRASSIFGDPAKWQVTGTTVPNYLFGEGGPDYKEEVVSITQQVTDEEHGTDETIPVGTETVQSKYIYERIDTHEETEGRPEFPEEERYIKYTVNLIPPDTDKYPSYLHAILKLIAAQNCAENTYIEIEDEDGEEHAQVGTATQYDDATVPADESVSTEYQLLKLAHEITNKGRGIGEREEFDHGEGEPNYKDKKEDGSSIFMITLRADKANIKVHLVHYAVYDVDVTITGEVAKDEFGNTIIDPDTGEPKIIYTSYQTTKGKLLRYETRAEVSVDVHYDAVIRGDFLDKVKKKISHTFTDEEKASFESNFQSFFLSNYQTLRMMYMGIGFGNGLLIWPVPDDFYICSGYGYRGSFQTDNGQWTNPYHWGVDMVNGHSYGEPIFAAADGIVYFASDANPGSGYGIYCIIDHDVNGTQIKTLYGHMSSLFVVTGESVAQGDIIGLVGATGNVTGPHLHFEIRSAANERENQEMLYEEFFPSKEPGDWMAK